MALGKGGTDISESDALACVWGYGVGVDLTRREADMDDIAGAAFAASGGGVDQVAEAVLADLLDLWRAQEGEARCDVVTATLPGPERRAAQPVAAL